MRFSAVASALRLLLAASLLSMRSLTCAYVLSDDPETEYEGQIYLYAQFFAGPDSRGAPVDSLFGWLRANLSKSGLDIVWADEYDNVFTRNMTKYTHVAGSNSTVFKYRETGYEGDTKSQNDLIWKIHDAEPGMETSPMICSSTCQADDKVELNEYCNGRAPEDVYSSYARLSYDEVVKQPIKSVRDVEVYFPGYGGYYGLDDAAPLYQTSFGVEHVVELEAVVSGRDVTFALVMIYDTVDQCVGTLIFCDNASDCFCHSLTHPELKLAGSRIPPPSFMFEFVCRCRRACLFLFSFTFLRHA